MDIRAQYLLAMREQAPELFKRLSRSGELETQAALVSQEAEKMFRELTKDAPRDEHGNTSLQARREAEEYVRAEFLNFPDPNRTPEQDELEYLLVGNRPLLSPDTET